MTDRPTSQPPPQTRRLFGTDGVRGVANVHPMTAEVALQLGRALAFMVRSGPHRHRIVIGKDTRLSGYLLEQAIASGICSMGVDVLMVGPMPTPGIAFITHSAEIRHILNHIGVESAPPHITPARGPPLWEGCDAPVDDGAQGEPDWDLAAQPDEVDQRVNW